MDGMETTAKPTLRRTADPNQYNVWLEGQCVGHVAKVRERTPVFANDPGYHYTIGHTERTRWTVRRRATRIGFTYRTRTDAVERLLAELAKEAR